MHRDVFSQFGVSLRKVIETSRKFYHHHHHHHHHLNYRRRIFGRKSRYISEAVVSNVLRTGYVNAIVVDIPNIKRPVQRLKRFLKTVAKHMIPVRAQRSCCCRRDTSGPPAGQTLGTAWTPPSRTARTAAPSSIVSSARPRCPRTAQRPARWTAGSPSACRSLPGSSRAVWSRRRSAETAICCWPNSVLISFVINIVIEIEIEQGLTCHQTYYRSYRWRVFTVKWPNQQCQSTERRHKTKLNQIQQNTKIHLN